MDDPEELRLVEEVLKEGLSGCVEWDGRSAEKVRGDRELLGLTPEWIKSEVIRSVRSGRARIKQKPEKRPEYRIHYRFYYKVVLRHRDFRHGLFVEIRLVDDDREYPQVLLVNAHPQSKT